MVVTLDHIVRSGESYLRARGMILRSVHMARHPRDSYIVSPSLLLEVATPKNKLIHSTLSFVRKEAGTRCGSPPNQWFLEGCSSPFMIITEHLTALRAWCTPCLLGR